MDKAIVGYAVSWFTTLSSIAHWNSFAPKSLANNKLLLGLSFIAFPLFVHIILFRELVGSSDITSW